MHITSSSGWGEKIIDFRIGINERFLIKCKNRQSWGLSIHLTYRRYWNIKSTGLNKLRQWLNQLRRLATWSSAIRVEWNKKPLLEKIFERKKFYNLRRCQTDIFVVLSGKSLNLLQTVLIPRLIFESVKKYKRQTVEKI